MPTTPEHSHVLAATHHVRRELKYAVDGAEADRLEALIEAHVPLRAWFPPARDAKLRSVYLDYSTGALTARSLAHPYDCMKVRYRRYDDPAGWRRTPDLAIWIEVKERKGDSVVKERTLYPGALLRKLLDGREEPPAGRIREVLAAGHLVAVAGVSYRRVAFEMPDESLRVTVDRNLAVFRPGPPGSHGTPVADLDPCVVEVKATADVPDWLATLLDRSVSQLSKFELAARALGLGTEQP